MFVCSSFKTNAVVWLDCLLISCKLPEITHRFLYIRSLTVKIFRCQRNHLLALNKKTIKLLLTITWLRVSATIKNDLIELYLLHTWYELFRYINNWHVLFVWKYAIYLNYCNLEMPFVKLTVWDNATRFVAKIVIRVGKFDR